MSLASLFWAPGRLFEALVAPAALAQAQVRVHVGLAPEWIRAVPVPFAWAAPPDIPGLSLPAAAQLGGLGLVLEARC